MGVPSQGQLEVAPGLGFYFNIGSQLSDRWALYFQGSASTALLAYSGGASFLVEHALANGRVTFGTGVGALAVYTLIRPWTGQPPSVTQLPSPPIPSVIVGVPFNVGVRFPAGGRVEARRGVRIGLESLTGVALLLPYVRPTLGMQMAITVGYEWY